jgi:hypothetical protein
MVILKTFLILTFFIFPLSCFSASAVKGIALSIPLTNLKATGPTGKLTKEDVKKWFLKAGLINKKITENPACITVSKLLESDGVRSAKSATADQIFFISNKCAETPQMLFVLKHYSNDGRVQKEISNLTSLKKSFRTIGFSTNMPRIVFNEFFYKYPSHKPEEYKYIGLIHPAKGQSLWSLLVQYTKERDPGKKLEYKENMLLACSKLGTVLANFHLKYMTGPGCPFRSRAKRLHDKSPEKVSFMGCKTKLHGDLHVKNIFWDKETQTISLIDIETLNRDPGNPIEEIGYTFGTLVDFSSSLFVRGEAISQKKRRILIHDLYKAFLTSYLQAYHARRPGPVYDSLVQTIKMFTVGIARFKGALSGQYGVDIWSELKEEF